MRWVLICLLLVQALFPGGSALGQTRAGQSPARVFVVHSYDAEYVWCQALNQGLRAALRGLPVELETVYLDAKHDLDQDSLRAKGMNALAKIFERRPAVVIAVDDAAQTHLVAPHLRNRGEPQVIFCGVNAPLSLYGYPAKNVSGVRERWHFRESFALLRKIQPSARRVALLTDMSESSGYVLDDMAEERRQGGPFAVKTVAVRRTDSFQQWQRLVRAAQKNADALALGIYLSLRDENTGAVVPGDTVAAWTDSANRLPTVGFADYVLRHGQMCGVLESAQEQGQLAGAMARQVLERGLAAGGLPVRVNTKGIVVVNLRTADRLKVQIPFEIIEAAEVVLK
ncbi:ABC-type uncharacterized transport system, substrate-binding protein [Humidesulfovibrio mexicanus]|uniref:ABC-type uncharacterized transport system, substrate-binding protein n=1 Tax=Humidesulfovibrio mexicanus TaxID=147047 RepID=A0A239AQ67_9BACT|nr:ABC transporter substrate binding protein [Humidesulfovibrio mexicanus]SNR97680.1 ABC-type uncharacterized transport system, substrate-binding protein [Humidesulfovibrio mexicanus]